MALHRPLLTLGHTAAIAALLLTAPSSFARTCDPRANGAKADGATKDTSAIQAAIDACSAAGDVVRLTSGIYLSAPLTLRSHTHLLIDKGATLLGSPDREDYPVRPDATWRAVALLHADQVTDLTISGEGTIDGSGKVWWTAQLSRKKGDSDVKRPLLIDLTRSKKILIEGVTIQNSPMYNITTFECDGLTVRNIKILNPGRGAPNTDGIDPFSTSHVLIEHDLIDTGDDNVAIKSGLVERGETLVPSHDITIRDCEFRNGHGLSIGSETAGGVGNVTVERVSFHGTRQGIRIKSARGRGNDLGHFTYRDITMEGVETPIQITAYYTGLVKDDTGQPMTEHTPRFHDITIDGLEAKGAKQAAVIMGLPESPIKKLLLRNVHISAAKGMLIQQAELTEDKVTIEPAAGPPAEYGPGVLVNGKKPE